MSYYSGEEVLAYIRERRSLQQWWDLIAEGVEYRGVTLVEKANSSQVDSYGTQWSGTASMVFKIMDEFYKLSVYHSSYGDMDWDNREQKWFGEDHESVSVSGVKPKVRTVSYYE